MDERRAAIIGYRVKAMRGLRHALQLLERNDGPTEDSDQSAAEAAARPVLLLLTAEQMASFGRLEAGLRRILEGHRAGLDRLGSQGVGLTMRKEDES